MSWDPAKMHPLTPSIARAVTGPSLFMTLRAGIPCSGYDLMRLYHTQIRIVLSSEPVIQKFSFLCHLIVLTSAS